MNETAYLIFVDVILAVEISGDSFMETSRAAEPGSCSNAVAVHLCDFCLVFFGPMYLALKLNKNMFFNLEKCWSAASRD